MTLTCAVHENDFAAFSVSYQTDPRTDSISRIVILVIFPYLGSGSGNNGGGLEFSKWLVQRAYRKNPKISDTQPFCCNHPKNWIGGSTIENASNGKRCRPWSDCSSRGSLIRVYSLPFHRQCRSSSDCSSRGIYVLLSQIRSKHILVIDIGLTMKLA